MEPRLGDILVLLRGWRLAIGLPAATVFAYRTLGDLMHAYDDVVVPIVDRTVSDPADRVRISQALRAMSMKIGLVMLIYARMVGCEQQLEVVVLAGAVTRLYDDLIDGDAGSSLDDRLSELFSARPFTAQSDTEQLLAQLFHGIADRVHPAPDGTVLAALNALHEYQCLSRRQRETGIAPDVLLKITRGKGAMANLTLCGLLKPDMDASERELIMALGEAFQQLDDYMDVEFDRRNGVTTLASLGVVTLADIATRMLVLRPRIAVRYGPAASRPFCGVIYFLLLKAFVGRRLPIIGRIARRAAGRSAMLTFLTRGDDALAPAVQPYGQEAQG